MFRYLNHTLLIVLLSAVLMFAGGMPSASAQDSGLYLRADTGWSWAGDADFKQDNPVQVFR